MAADWQDAKEQVRQAVDIVDLVGGYVSLRRQGRGYVGICPWHDDSKPSLQVNPERQSFKCWVCDIGGDIFSFIMKVEGVDFREALEMLADRAGIELRQARSADAESEFDRRNLYRVAAWAEQQFHQRLKQAADAEPARRYLADRGISPESVDRFHIGFAPNEWDWLLKQAAGAGISGAVMERIGLAATGHNSDRRYDRFRGRLIFPIRDTRSRAIAFGGRVLPGVGDGKEAAKYINSPETPLFSKSNQLYALDLAREGIGREGGVVVMEGYTDVVMAHQHGVTNTVAVLGTALGEKHVPLVRRFTDRVTLVLDGDQAGQDRTMSILDSLLALFVKKEIDLRILTLPGGSDPCDVIASQGRESFDSKVRQAVDPIEYKINAETKGLDTATDTHRASQALERILSTVAKASGSNSQKSAAMLREQQVLSRLSHEFGIGEEPLRLRLSEVRRQQSNQDHSSPRRFDAALEVISQPHSRSIPAFDREVIELLLHAPDTHGGLFGAIGETDFRHPAAQALFAEALAIHDRGEAPTFDTLMLGAEDPELKSLIVECDESGAQKSNSDTARRLQDLLGQKQSNEEKARHESMLAGFRKRELTPEKEDECLGELFQDLSRRQASSKPTDG
ncbi:MAG: DNA primase [Planctomycetota bacterium]